MEILGHKYIVNLLFWRFFFCEGVLEEKEDKKKKG